MSHLPAFGIAASVAGLAAASTWSGAIFASTLSASACIAAAPCATGSVAAGYGIPYFTVLGIHGSKLSRVVASRHATVALIVFHLSAAGTAFHGSERPENRGSDRASSICQSNSPRFTVIWSVQPSKIGVHGSNG